MPGNPLSMEFFETKYQQDADPWQFGNSPYELNRYEEIIRTLGGRTFQRAFEPGCSIGILTARLAVCCDKVLAMDISPTAVERAREHCCAYPGVTIQQGCLPHDLPEGDFDLIVFSEIGYYFDHAGLYRLAEVLISRLRPGGLLVAAHWLGSSEDHVLHGDQVHAILRKLPGLEPGVSHRFEGFRIDSWRVVPDGESSLMESRS